jgi:hypothetical protein
MGHKTGLAQVSNPKNNDANQLIDKELLEAQRLVAEVGFVEGSTLTINGKSNITEFSCVSEHELTQRALAIEAATSTKSVTVSGAQLQLEVHKFNCGRAPINRDFRATLKAEQHPHIVLKLDEIIYNSDAPNYIQALMTINIAGVDRNEIVEIEVTDPSKEIVAVKGAKRLKITDFNLTPPTAMFGLIKVEDELDISFDLKIQRNR